MFCRCRSMSEGHGGRASARRRARGADDCAVIRAVAAESRFDLVFLQFLCLLNPFDLHVVCYEIPLFRGAFYSWEVITPTTSVSPGLSRVAYLCPHQMSLSTLASGGCRGYEFPRTRAANISAIQSRVKQDVLPKARSLVTRGEICCGKKCGDPRPRLVQRLKADSSRSMYGTPEGVP
jgi:hypothetical protein